MGAETKNALKKAKKKAKKEKKFDLAYRPDDDKDEDDVVDGSKEHSDTDDDEKKESKKKSKNSGSKSSSKKRPLEDEDDDEEEEAEGKSSSSIDKATDRAQRKALKKQQKSALLSKIPKLDPDGIPYNKIQIRRMLRRVKHGLDPVATDEEEKEIREREKREKVEEERLLFEEGRGGGDDDEEEEVDGNDDDKQDQGEDDDDEAAEEDDGDEQEDDDAQDTPKQNKQSHNPPSKKTKRSKPVPPDYICQACQNNLPDFTPHWIYDCPNKVTKRGCNTVSKKLRGLHDPPSRKVFVSGLPFECTEGHVKRYFETHMDNNNAADTPNESTELVHCKLLKFEDSNRCKGQAFLTFDSDLGAKLALKLNGSVWEDIEEPGTSSKKKKSKKAAGASSADTKKELRLKVTKVLNRHVTKKKAGK